MKVNTLERAKLYRRALATKQLEAYADISKTNQKVSDYIYSDIGMDVYSDRFSTFNRINILYLSKAANNDLSFLTDPDFVSDFDNCSKQDQEFITGVITDLFKASQSYDVFKKADEQFTRLCLQKDRKTGETKFYKTGLSNFYSKMDKMLDKDAFHIVEDDVVTQIGSSESSIFSNFNNEISKHSPNFLGHKYYKLFKENCEYLSNDRYKASPVNFGTSLKKPALSKFPTKYKDVKLCPLTEKGYAIADYCRNNPKGAIKKVASFIMATYMVYGILKTEIAPGIVDIYEKATTSFSDPTTLEKYELSLSEDTLDSIQELKAQVEKMQNSDQIPTQEEFFETKKQADQLCNAVVKEIFTPVFEKNFPDKTIKDISYYYDERFSENEKKFEIFYTDDESGTTKKVLIDASGSILEGEETTNGMINQEKKLDELGYPNFPGGYFTNAVPIRLAIEKLKNFVNYIDDIAVNQGKIKFTFISSLKNLFKKHKTYSIEDISSIDFSAPKPKENPSVNPTITNGDTSNEKPEKDDDYLTY